MMAKKMGTRMAAVVLAAGLAVSMTGMTAMAEKSGTKTAAEKTTETSAESGAETDKITLTQAEDEETTEAAENTEDDAAEADAADQADEIEEDTGDATAADEVTVIENVGPAVLSTDYPGVSVKPGEAVTFKLYLTNDSETQADLKLTAENVPEGWDGYFKGSSNAVSSVHLGTEQTKDNSPALSYSLTVPADAANGEYKIQLVAEGTTAADEKISTATEITVEVNADEKAGDSTFTAEYPEQQGASGTNFSYSTTLVNNASDAETFALSYDAPEGWNVTFTPSGSSAVSSVPVEAGASQALTVAVTPSQQVTAGDYDITLIAASGTQSLQLPLKVTITGTYGLQLTTPTGNLSATAYAGEETKVTLSLQNTGNIDLKGVKLSGQGSTDWNITFDKDTVDEIKAGEAAEVTATIQPAKNAVIGDYVAAVTAKNDSVSSEADFRVSVKNHTTWGFVAVGVIALLAIGLGLIIKKYGRR